MIYLNLPVHNIIKNNYYNIFLEENKWVPGFTFLKEHIQNF